MGTISIFASITFIALFVLALVSFSGYFGIYNNSNILLDNDTSYSSLKEDVRQNLTIFYGDSNTAFNETMKSTISSQTEATEGGTAFKVGPATAMKMSTSSIKVGFEKIFGSGNEFQVYFTSFITFLGFMVLLYIYKSWKGSPD